MVKATSSATLLTIRVTSSWAKTVSRDAPDLVGGFLVMGGEGNARALVRDGQGPVQGRGNLPDLASSVRGREERPMSRTPFGTALIAPLVPRLGNT